MRIEELSSASRPIDAWRGKNARNWQYCAALPGGRLFVRKTQKEPNKSEAAGPAGQICVRILADFVQKKGPKGPNF
jgi:hypothetical protein